MMDPDEALTQLREMVERNKSRDLPINALEAFDSLDQWLSRGGFLPHDWAHRESHMIRLDAAAAEQLRDRLNMAKPLAMIRFWFSHDSLKYKINHWTWTPEVGVRQERY